MITLGYWGVRGRAHTLRLLLEYTGANWQETTYTNDADWFGRDKPALGLPFPNLPYLIDGTLKLTETAAIARYIIERSSNQELLGKDIRDKAIVNNLVGVIADCNDAFAAILYQKNGLSLRDASWKRIAPRL
jgi:glutathione S-transferase